jgi:threonine aldolase
MPSDNVGTVAPEIMEAILAANSGTAAAYGEDA